MQGIAQEFMYYIVYFVFNRLLTNKSGVFIFKENYPANPVILGVVYFVCLFIFGLHLTVLMAHFRLCEQCLHSVAHGTIQGSWF